MAMETHLRDRKLTHHLSREGRVFCSESSTLRILRKRARSLRQRRSKPEQLGVGRSRFRFK